MELSHRIADFVVTPRCKSDHNPLVLEVVFLKPEHNQNFSAHSASNLIATEGGRRVRCGTFVQSIEKWLIYMNKLSHIWNLPFKCLLTSCLESLLEIGKNHKVMLSKLVVYFYSGDIKKCPNVKNGQTWYNKSCRGAKHALLLAVKDKDGLRTKETRDEYKKKIIEAKLSWELDRWEAIKKALDNRDMRGFWNLVRTGKPEGNMAIEPNLREEVWRSHF